MDVRGLRLGSPGDGYLLRRLRGADPG